MRFSSRVPGSLELSRLARLIAARPAQWDLTLSNPTIAGFDYPAGLLAALADPGAMKYEPDARGWLPAREAIARHHGGRVSAQRIFLTSSTSESYSWLFKLLCEPGDRVLVPRPSYPLFECLAQLDGVAVDQYPLIERMDWAIDFEALEQLATPRTRALILVNPNNPTGTFLKSWELERLAEVSRRRQLPVISDEVFSGYGWSDDPALVRSLAGETRFPVFVLNGLSKPAGLPQMKLGWIVAPEEAVARLEWIADAYLPVSAPVQRAAAEWLRLTPGMTEQIRARTLVNLGAAREALAGSAARLLPAEGGWCAVVELPKVLREEDWVAAFLDKGVLAHPGFFFDFEREAFAVISLLPAPGAFREAVNQIRLTLIERLL